MNVVNGASTTSRRPDRTLTELRAINAKGNRVLLGDGRWYHDWQLGLHGAIFGYRPLWMLEVLDERAFPPTSIACVDEWLVAQQLEQFYPFDAVRFSCNGSDPCAAAVKLARAWTGRDRILSCGYHGWSSAYCPGPSNARPNLGDFPRNLGTLQAERDAHVAIGWLENIDFYFDSYACDGTESYPAAPAMIIVECPPVDGGKEEASAWLKKLSRHCHRTGALFALDEVVTGFRYGSDGAMGYYGLTTDDVDLLMLGKTLGNGYPVSALLGRGDVMELLAGIEGRGQVHFSGTFFGEPTGMALASATLRQLLDDPPWVTLYRAGRLLIESWNEHDLPWKLEGHPTRPVVWPTPKEEDEAFLDLRRHLFRNGHVFVDHPLYMCTETSVCDIESLCQDAERWYHG